MKMHLSFATSDLSKSVAFYTTLLEAQPVKRHDDYALFVTEDPGLELALDRDDEVRALGGAHFGVAVESTAHVERAIERLSAAGLADSIERESTCCYANQTKVWASDPDGRRWEIYTVHADVDERDDEKTACCS